MRFGHIDALCFAGVAAGVALAVAGVVWLDIGTARQPATAKSHFAPQPAVAVRRDLSSTLELPATLEISGALPAPDTRSAEMREVIALADTPGTYTEAALAAAALSHAQAAVREEAIHALGERGGVIALQTLQQTLLDPSPRVRDATVRAFVDVGGNEAASVLSTVLSATDASLRMGAVDALGQIRAPDSRRYLTQMLQDESAAVREAAAEWLVELSHGQGRAPEP